MTEPGGFDAVWQYIPQFSSKQLMLTAMTGIISLQDGLLCMYPIFAAYEPRSIACQSGRANTTIEKINSCIEQCNTTVSDVCYTSTVGMKDCSCDEKCTSWTYDDELLPNTVVSEWDLHCDKTWIRDTIFSVGNVGLSLGSFIGGPMTEIYGRKFTMFSVTVLTVISLAAQTFSSNLAVFVTFWTITKVLSQIKYLAYSSYAVEVIGPDWRGFTGQMNHVYYSIGTIIASLFSFYFRSWQDYTAAILAIHTPLLLAVTVIPESPRWLFMKGRTQEGKVALRALVGENAFYKKISPKFYESLEKKEDTSEAKQKPDSVVDIFRFPRIRMVSFMIFYVFFVISMVYMGISYNADNLPGNVWLINAVNGVLDGVSQFAGMAALLRYGRRSILGVCLTITAICYLSADLIRLKKCDELAPTVVNMTSMVNITEVENKCEVIIETASLAMAFSAKFFISASFSVVYTYTAELFPTSVRTIGLGIGSLGGGLGGVLAPYILALQRKVMWLPSAIFGVFSIIAALLLLFMPETMGRPLQESIAGSEATWSKKKEEVNTVAGSTFTLDTNNDAFQMDEQ